MKSQLNTIVFYFFKFMKPTLHKVLISLMLGDWHVMIALPTEQNFHVLKKYFNRSLQVVTHVSFVETVQRKTCVKHPRRFPKLSLQSESQMLSSVCKMTAMKHSNQITVCAFYSWEFLQLTARVTSKAHRREKLKDENMLNFKLCINKSQVQLFMLSTCDSINSCSCE